jgi:hypothetical protein
MNQNFSNFPSQKKSISQKTKQWRKDCIDSVDSTGSFFDERVRQTYHNKLINLNLYNGVVSAEDIQKYLNPEDIQDETLPESFVHYPIVNPRIDLLVGEEFKRKFDYQFVVINPNAVSLKSKEMRDKIQAEVQQLIEQNVSEDQIEKTLEDLQFEMMYTFQDKREIRANNISKYLYKKLRLDRLFNEGFRDVLVVGEEFYQADIVGNEPVLTKINPMNVFFTRSGFSNKIEDSDLIIIDEYWSPGRIVDQFYDKLKATEIDRLERGYGSGGNDPFVDKLNMEPLPSDAMVIDDGSFVNDLLQIGKINGFRSNRAYDDSGNIRVLRVYWKSFRKVLKVTFFDEFGNEQVDYFPETYTPKKDEGEYAEVQWISEWWEGTKIGHDIYIKMQPKEVQYSSMLNPSYCHPGITGRVYSLNDTVGISMMDKTKQYQYLYDVIHDRLNKMLAKNHGKILELDLAVVPRGWDVQTWMFYFKKMNVAVRDSFKEGEKGAATGKLAGGMNNASKGYIDLETGAYIQQHIGLLEYIKKEMTEITGVSEQRLGQVAQSETVGGIERSVTQSSHITEWYFSVHDEVKLEAMRILLETAKVAYKNKKETMQFVLDDGSIKMFDFDGDAFSENDYGVVMTSSTEMQNKQEKIEQLAQVAMNAGVLGFEVATAIILSNSTAEMRRKIEQSAKELKQQQQQNAEADREVQMQDIQAQQERFSQQLNLENIKSLRDNATKMNIALLNDQEDNSMQETIEKLKLEEKKRADELLMFMKDMEQRKREHEDNKLLKKEEIGIKRIAANKKPTTKK